MNFQIIWPAIQPFLTQLLRSPQFQALLKQILDDIVTKIATGVHPDTAVQQATGQIGAAAMLHLTGNSVVDFASVLSNFNLLVKASPPAAGTFTS